MSSQVFMRIDFFTYAFRGETLQELKPLFKGVYW